MKVLKSGLLKSWFEVNLSTAWAVEGEGTKDSQYPLSLLAAMQVWATAVPGTKQPRGSYLETFLYNREHLK